ncbi:CHAT domain-containing protein [Mycena latifolia]|nr:CHAT domain-containing protein [Mycena latifolia]
MSAQSVSMSDGSDDEWVTESESADSHTSHISLELDIKIQNMQHLIQQTPQGHPNHCKYQQLLGVLFQERYHDSEEIKDLESCLQSFQVALDLSREGHPERAECFANLGVVLTDRYQRLGDLKDLEAALQNDQRSVDLTPKEDPDRASRLQHLAISFMDRYHTLGESKDLEAALEKFQEAVGLTPAEDPDRAAYVEGLAEAFRDKYKVHGDLPDLEAALANFQEAVDQTPSEDPYRARYLQHLAASFTDRYRRLGELKDLEAALQADQEAVALTPNGDPERASCLQSLATSFRDRFERMGDLKDLEAAMQNFKEALGLTVQDDPDRPEHLQNLAVCYADRYKRLGDLKDLEFVLKKLQKAVTLFPEDHPSRVLCLQNLSASFADRYHRLGELKDLEDALQLDQEIVKLTPEGHSERAARLYQLAVSFRDRYQRLAHLKDLETALHTVNEAVSLTPEGHPERARRLQTLAMSFRDRYQTLGDLADLETALPKFQQAVDLTPEGHSDRAENLRSLAIALGDRYRRFGELADLQAALHNDHCALDLMPEDHPARARCLQSLAISFRDQYLRLGEPKDLEVALQRFQDAVNHTPLDHHDRAEHLHDLAMCLGDHYKRFGDLKSLEAALQLGQEAVNLTPKDNPDRPGRLQGLAECFQENYLQLRDPKDLAVIHMYYIESFQSPSLTPEDSWQAALLWASFASEFQPSDCVTAYLAAFDLLPQLLWIGHTIPVRHDVLRRLDIGEVTSTAAKTCIDLNDLTSAVVIMEQGLATIFQQMLQLKTDVNQLQPTEAETFRKISVGLFTGKSNNQMALAIQRKELLESIRQKPGLEHFLLPKPYNVLRHASQGGPIVILNSHGDHCDALIILDPTSHPVHVPLANVTLDMLYSQQVILKDLLGRGNIRSREQSASSRLFGQQEQFTSKPLDEFCTELLAWLWIEIVSPVYDALRLHGILEGRLWWLPTGSFTGLPLHACPPTDQFIHSYTATLGSLIDAYGKKSSAIGTKFSIIGVTHTGPHGLNSLKGVKQEVAKILSIIRGPVDFLDGQQATVDAVKIQLQNCSWIHLACHGKQELGDPTKSYLKLYGGNLELDTILRMPLANAEFVFLAACQTAMGDAELENESFHLGGAFIAAGFRGAIGTLWAMNDQDGPVVAEIVYSHLCHDGRQPQASEAAGALQLAVNELKARKVPYERWIPFIHMGI